MLSFTQEVVQMLESSFIRAQKEETKKMNGTGDNGAASATIPS